MKTTQYLGSVCSFVYCFVCVHVTLLKTVQPNTCTKKEPHRQQRTVFEVGAALIGRGAVRVRSLTGRGSSPHGAAWSENE